MKNLFKMVVMVFRAFSVVLAAASSVRGAVAERVYSHSVFPSVLKESGRNENVVEAIFIAEAEGLDKANPKAAVALYKRMLNLRGVNQSLYTYITPKVMLDLLQKYGFILSLEAFGSSRAPAPIIQELISRGINHNKIPLLHFAVKYSYVTVFSWLLERLANHADRIQALNELIPQPMEMRPLGVALATEKAALFEPVVLGYGYSISEIGEVSAPVVAAASFSS